MRSLRFASLAHQADADIAALREWSVGTVQIASASLSGLHERNFAGGLRFETEEGTSAIVPAVDRQDASGPSTSPA